MRFQTLGDRPGFIAEKVRNMVGSGTSILKGQPVILKLSGTDDGLQVILPSGGSAALNEAFMYGVALEDIADNNLGDVMRAGVHRSATIVRQTRSAATAVWLTQATLAQGVFLFVNSVYDALSSGASTQVGTDANTLFQVPAYLAESLASFASSASATSDVRTAITVSAKAFLRML
jgi:hypothetical protein